MASQGVLTTPPPGSTCASSSVTFAWTAGVGVTEYWLWIGSSAATSDLWAANHGLSLSATVTGLPVDGRPLYVRLWSVIGGTDWQFTDYTYWAVYGLTQPAVLGARLNTFRLGYMPAALIPIRATRVGIWLSGERITGAVKVGSLRISDILNDAPNTCQFTYYGPAAPLPNQKVRVTLNPDAPVVLFSGTLQTVAISYVGRPSKVAWECAAIDDTALANRRRPFGTWTRVSATDVAVELIETSAPDLSTAGIEADLPPVDIFLDGTEGMSAAFDQLANLIGGYFKFEDGVAYLFTELTDDPCDPIDDAHPFLNDPPITSSADVSQLRTRVYGRGHGEAVPVEVAAGETIVPLDDVVMFDPVGGGAIAGTTPDGAPTQIISYTGTIGRGAGSTVGPSLSPSVAPVLTAQPGSGLAAGVYQGAYTFVTALGESLPSPLAPVTTGFTPAPATPVSPSGVSSGAAFVDVGGHDYVVTFVTPTGETSVSPISGQAWTSVVPGFTVSPPADTPFAQSVNLNSTNLAVGDLVYYAFTYVTGSGGETTIGPVSNTIVIAMGALVPNGGIVMTPNLVPGATGLRCYRNRNGIWDEQITGASPGFNMIDNGFNNQGGSPPGTNTATVPPVYTQQVFVGNLPVSPHAYVTARKLYRRFNGATPFKLAQTIPNNSATYTYDMTPNASLGALAPVPNTAEAAQVAVAGIATGPAGTTARKYYRTTANGSQLKLQQTIADNSNTTGVQDATPDGSLGANAPTSNTSGLAMVGGTGSGFYTSAAIIFAANGAATAATSGAPIFTSATYVFVPADVGARLYIQSGTNWTPGFYDIVSVSGGTATLNRACASVASPTAGRWGVDYSGLAVPRFTYVDLTIDASASTKCTSAAFPFGPHCIGNALSIANGVGFIEQQVIIVSVAGVVATCDKVLGSVGSTGGRATLGGAPATPFVLAGSPTLITAGAGPFRAAGGWVKLGDQFVRYAGITGNVLTGIPPIGTLGALLNTVAYGDPIAVIPALTGVSGLALPMVRGTPVHIWVERNDLAAQAEQAAIDAANGRVRADGIYEGPILVDERRGILSLTAWCDATLQIFARPIRTVRYPTRNLKTKSGKPVTVNLASPPITADLVIQEVQISEIDIAPGLAPRFDVSASSTRFSLDSLLRKLTKALGV